MTESAGEAVRRETLLVAWAALALALVSLAYCVRHGSLLLYGDAVAHLHIARRVFDSITPGYRQLGSVWLPLPHILLLPFVWNLGWWQSGLAGACLSIPSYVLACAGVYRLGRLWLDTATSIVVVAFFGLNPGLLYMATTAMTEPLFLAEMIWAVVLLVLYERALLAGEERAAGRLLIGTGLVLVAAIYTRYDGWVYAAVAWVFATVALLRWFGARVRASHPSQRARRMGHPPLSGGERLRRRFNYHPFDLFRGEGLGGSWWRGPVVGGWVLFTALLVATPSFWLAYNAKQFGDPLDFLRGPYSARAIEAKTSPPGAANHPGFHNMHDSALYFLKAGELGAAPPSLGKLLCWMSAAGTVLACWVFRGRQIWPMLLLWLPLPFYAYSVAYGSVPIFIPVWRPYSWYNTRYGMELLPAFALFAGCVLPLLAARWPRARLYVAAFCFLLVVANSGVLLRLRPLVFQEAVMNARSRVAFESALTKALLELPSERILMRVSSDVGAVQQAGIPLRRVVNEGDYLTWQQALKDPARSASTVIALDGDVVADAVHLHPEGLQLVNVICSTGQPCAHIYRSLVWPSR